MKPYLFGLVLLAVLGLFGQQKNSTIGFSGKIKSGSSQKPSFDFGKKDIGLLWLDPEKVNVDSEVVGVGDFHILRHLPDGSFELERRLRLKVFSAPSKDITIRLREQSLKTFVAKVYKRRSIPTGNGDLVKHDTFINTFTKSEMIPSDKNLAFDISEKAGPGDYVDIIYTESLKITEKINWTGVQNVNFQVSEFLMNLPPYYSVRSSFREEHSIDSLQSSQIAGIYQTDTIQDESVAKSIQSNYLVHKWVSLNATGPISGFFKVTVDKENLQNFVGEYFQGLGIKSKDAQAIIFYDRATNDLDAGVFRREMKIKVLSKEGLSWGDFETPFVPGNASSRLAKVQVTVTNGEGEEQEITKMTKESIYKVDIDNRGAVYRFSAPNVRIGSVIDVSYTLNIFSALDWTFQNSVPTMESHYKVIIPDFVNFSKELKGYVPISFEEYFEKQNKVLEFKGEKIPAFESEPYINSSKNYASGVSFVFTGFGSKGGILSEWRDVIRILGESQSFGYYLKPGKSIRLVAENIVGEGGSEQEIAIKCYDHIRETIDWNKITSIGAQNDMKKVLEKEAGSSGEINLMLVSLLRKAGLSANPILMKTRNEGVMNFSMPRLSELNYVVAGVRTAEGLMILDATDKDRNWSLLPLRALNTFGVMINESNYAHEIVEIPGTQFSKLDVFATAKLDSDGTISGTCQKSYAGFSGFEFRENSDSLEVVDLESRISNLNSAVEVSSYKQIIPEDLIRASKERFDFSMDGQEIADNVILEPVVVVFVEDNPFSEEQRKYPISIPYAHDFSYRLKLEIPENMVVTSLPKEENLGFEMSGGGGSILTLAKQVGNTIQLTYNFKLDCTYILPEEYDRIRGFYDTVVRKQAEKIALSKLN